MSTSAQHFISEEKKQKSFASVPSGAMSEVELSTIARLAELGWSPGRVARSINRARSSVAYQMLKMGFASAPQAKPVSGGGKRFSPDEDAFITACRVAGHSHAAIARACAKRFGHKRERCTIRLRLLTLAARDGAGDPS